MKPIITAEICNYNGFRNAIDGIGRLERTLASIPPVLWADHRIRWRAITCNSPDGSDALLQRCRRMNCLSAQRISSSTEWESTTRTNALLLTRTLNRVTTPYLWRIENDSVFLPTPFVQGGCFLWEALEALERYRDIGLIHLRRWTPVDRFDLPGAGMNASRFSHCRPLKNGFLYVIEQQPEQLIWIDVTHDLLPSFQPSEESGYGQCADFYRNGPVQGAVLSRRGRWFRLTKEAYATYVNHGWVARVSTLRRIFDQFAPETEDEIADAVRSQTKAARLRTDAFIAAGWRTRLSLTSDLLKFATEWAARRPHGTMRDRGGIEPVGAYSQITHAAQANAIPNQSGPLSIY